MTAPTLKHLIGGRLVESKTTQWRDVVNPATQQVVARVPFATKEELDLAVASAQEAFQTWRFTSVPARMRVMLKFQQLLRDNIERLAQLITTEHGKTLPDADRGGRAAAWRWSSTPAASPACSSASSANNAASGVDVYTLIQPLGVVAGLTAVQLPGHAALLHVPHRRVHREHLRPEAVRAGSELRARARRAGARGRPPARRPQRGAWRRRGRDTPSATTPEIKAVSFIGSTGVGRKVYERASQAGKRCQTMMGAKNHCVILPDAVREDGAQRARRGGLRRRGPALHGDPGGGLRRRGAELDPGVRREGPHAEGRSRHRQDGGPRAPRLPVGPGARREAHPVRRGPGGEAGARRARREGRRAPRRQLRGPDRLHRREAGDGHLPRGDLRPGPLHRGGRGPRRRHRSS